MDASPLSSSIGSQIRWQWSRLEGLTSAEIYAALAARQRVFTVEQQCAFLDADGLDAFAWHLLGWTSAVGSAELVAYLRVIDAGRKFPEPSIGRVLTVLSARGRGLGRTLMREGLARTLAAWPGHPIRVAAQQRLEAFYASLGFRTMAAPYVEDDILHVDMMLENAR